jgi:hypothetical protein
MRDSLDEQFAYLTARGIYGDDSGARHDVVGETNFFTAGL